MYSSSQEGGNGLGRSRFIFGEQAERAYAPCPIPPRGREAWHDRNCHPPLAATGSIGSDAASNPFAEVSVSDTPREGGGEAFQPQTRSGTQALHHLQPQPIEPLFDATRERFVEMRHIARQGSWYNMDRAEVFYHQASFMESFTDDHEDPVEFSCYYPRYQKMSHSQLRTYFTWRTAAREGAYGNVSVSYGFLYLYELLNGIGVEDPQDGLEKIMAFWSAFRAYHPLIDRYVIAWLKDYHIYYPLHRSFGEFAAAYSLETHYPSVFCADCGQENSLEMFAGISSYDVKKSRFWTPDTEPLMRDCFHFVLCRLREAFQVKKKRFEDFVFHSTNRMAKWSPFAKALFYPAFDQPDRVVRISEGEAYECTDQLWRGKTVLPTEQGRQLVGYIMKEMESQLRIAERFKHRLNVRFEAYKAIDRDALAQLGLSIPDIVHDACAEFYGLHTWKEVTVDLGNLKAIRDDALATQEKLLVPEGNDDAGEVPASASPTTPAAPTQGAEAPGCVSARLEEPQDCWTQLQSLLDETEMEALALALQDKPLMNYAMQRNVMLEVLIDGINQKAMDSVGDAIIEAGDAVIVYDEYREELLKAVSS